jgi:release factor glutamine methyltransferase
MGVGIFIAPGALIPRAETELLGWTALDVLRQYDEPRVIDMCCGSGNLTCGLVMNHPSVQVWASDLTDGAIAVAQANVERLAVSKRVTLNQGDLFSPLAGLGLEGTIDLVICNPPYISTGKLAKDSASLLMHEPREAFDGGPYGVSVFQRVLREAAPFLKPGGNLMFEIGVGQERQVTMLFARTNTYEAVRAIRDASGDARVIVGRKK